MCYLGYKQWLGVQIFIGEGKPYIQRFSGSLDRGIPIVSSLKLIVLFVYVFSHLQIKFIIFFSIPVITASGLVNYFLNFHIQPWFYVEFIFHTSVYCHFKSLWKMTEKCITKTKFKIDEIAFSRQSSLYSNKYYRDRHVKSALSVSHHLLNSSCNL